MGFNFYWANIATFLMIFYTDVFGITAAAAGSMLFTIKIVNAFTDPMIAAAADRTNTRFGKFRPNLIWAAIPLAAVLEAPSVEQVATWLRNRRGSRWQYLVCLRPGSSRRPPLFCVPGGRRAHLHHSPS